MGLKKDTGSDIETIKKNVAPALALGSVGRRVNATVQRLRATADIFHKASFPEWQKYFGPAENAGKGTEYTREGFCRWLAWICEETASSETNYNAQENEENGEQAPPVYRNYNWEPVLTKQLLDLQGSEINHIKGWKALGDLRNVITEILHHSQEVGLQSGEKSEKKGVEKNSNNGQC
jgi:hypothetical protein